MNKIEVTIDIISGAKSQAGNFVVVLKDKDNENKKLPIIIKPADAQFIAIKFEGVKTTRPMTQDLFKTLTDGYNINIEEVLIHNVIEGIFYARLKTSSSKEKFDIDCTVGDALSMSVLYNCPIYVSEDVMALSGVDIDVMNNNIQKLHPPPTKRTSKKQTIEDLNNLLQMALDQENYEEAVKLRDKIAKLNVK